MAFGLYKDFRNVIAIIGSSGRLKQSAGYGFPDEVSTDSGCDFTNRVAQVYGYFITKYSFIYLKRQ